MHKKGNTSRQNSFFRTSQLLDTCLWLGVRSNCGVRVDRVRQADLEEQDRCETQSWVGRDGGRECDSRRSYLWCPVAAGEAAEAVAEEGEGIFYSGMPAGTVR